MKYSVVTFGCRVNQADSLGFEAELAARGGEAVSPERAELVIVNTCSVTASADQGARQTIRRVARENPSARIVATGCYATRCASELEALPGVVAVVPNEEKSPARLFRRLEAEGVMPLGVAPIDLAAEGPCGRTLMPGLMGRTAWTLRVQTGCEESCSYCIIPTTRGASRSRTWDDISREMHRVLEAGYREVALTGVHLGAYGRDLIPATSLAQLLEALAVLAGRGANDAPDDERSRQRVLLRVSSLEPMDFPLALLDGASDGGKRGPAAVAPHFHLPLQHASNRVLEAMRRPYTIEQYAALVETIRARLPHAAIGSDVIVGFPGESERDFELLANYLLSSPITHVHVFPYSDRPGTAASSLPSKVHGSVVKARAQRVREISRVLGERFRRSLRGTVRPALAIEDGRSAVTDNYVRVPLPDGHARNEWVMVEL